MGGNVFAEARVRGQWLLGLLARKTTDTPTPPPAVHPLRTYLPTHPLPTSQCLQSLSSVVLAAPANRELVNDHLVITLFLTMLVGAGGNAGALRG